MTEARPGGRSAATFRPVVPQKATDLIADQIRQRIFSHEFVPGQMLPSEAELVRQTASSSASVRGALRALEAQGLIQMKPGRSGGAVVQLPGEAELMTTVNQLIRGQALGLGDLLDMQEALEPFCAELAAQHRNEADLADIDDALADITGHEGDVTSLLDAHSHWHIVMARASHNELLSGLMIALVSWIHLATQDVNLEAGRIGSASYEAITAAVRDEDAPRARREMHRHVSTRADALRRLRDGDRS
ncbi:MAG TPA: FCD domain-containing protein [Microbacterium sp.]|nr:FCD domain-containing protein [Microbacterium sp.]